MEISIRLASLAEKDAHIKFLETAYAEEGDVLQQKMVKRWSWQYRENPCIDQAKDDLTVVIANRGDQIVGQACLTPVKLKIENQYHLAFWGGDTIVLPQYRGGGVATKIMQGQIDNARFMIGIRAHPITFKVALKLGYQKLKPVPIYRRFVRFDDLLFFHYLMKATQSKPAIKWIARVMWKTLLIGKMVAAVTFLALGLRNLLERRPKKKGLTDIEAVQNFDERIDRLWSLTNNQYDVIVKRDSEFLNWRYSPHTMLDYRKFIATRDDEIKGYSVLRKQEPGERNFGIIVDLYASRDDQQTIEDLIRHALQFFSKDVTAIACAVSIKEYQKALSNFGFLRMESAFPIFCCENSSLADKLISLKDKCFFTKGDHDWDSYTPFRPG
jgi:predicted GNAT family N-acyltransferase